MQQWFYLYFGYSRGLRRAFAKVHLTTGVVKAAFTEVNHYLSPTFRFFLVQDKFYPLFSGEYASVKVLFCAGSYNPDYPPSTPPDVPNFIPPAPLPPPEEAPKEEKKQCIRGPDAVIDTSSLGKSAVDVTVTPAQLKDTTEYGYGYWLRYLTRYPTAQLEGLKQQQYFVSRLTKNIEYKNLGFGDRMLGIWQG
jgi:hypothetical protein